MDEKKQLSDISDEELSQKLRSAVHEKFPNLERVFDKDIDGVVASLKSRLERIFKVDPNLDVDKHAQFEAEDWGKEKDLIFTYSKYTKLMEEQGLTPVPMRGFKTPHHRADKKFGSPYQRMKQLINKNITLGTKVSYKAYKDDKPKITTVTKISPQVILSLGGSAPNSAIYFPNLEKAEEF
ncbi:hypothetical protein ACFLZH_00495 [Patescibacteria group bacterium]